MDIVDGIGALGAGLILAGFLLRASAQYGVGTVLYGMLNVLGAGILIWYGWVTGVWPFVILNGVWFLDAMRILIFKK